MDMKYALLLVLSLLCIPQIAFAESTVTLTGTCSSMIINETANYITFNLSNSGNGAATNLLLVPQLEGATTQNTTVSIPLLAPGGIVTSKIYLGGFNVPGTYTEYITVRYSQDSSTFMTIFPCPIAIKEKAQSLVQILDVNRTGSKLSIKLYNLANYAINANVTIFSPPAFTIQPEVVQVSVGPKGRTTANFNITTPTYTGAQFPVVASVSYTQNGIHYSAMGTVLINFLGESSSSLFNPSTTTLLVILVVLVLVVLIILSILKKKWKDEGKDAAQTKPQNDGVQK